MGMHSLESDGCPCALSVRLYSLSLRDRRTGDHRPPAPNTSILTPGHEGDDGSECSRMLLLGSVFIISLPITL